MPVRSLAGWFSNQARPLAFIYLLIIPAVIVVLAGVAAHNLSTNRSQTRAQRQLIMQNQKLIASNQRLAASNCARSEYLLEFVGDVAVNAPAASLLRREYLRLVARYDQLQDCPPFKGRR